MDRDKRNDSSHISNRKSIYLLTFVILLILSSFIPFTAIWSTLSDLKSVKISEDLSTLNFYDSSLDRIAKNNDHKILPSIYAQESIEELSNTNFDPSKLHSTLDLTNMFSSSSSIPLSFTTNNTTFTETKNNNNNNIDLQDLNTKQQSSSSSSSFTSSSSLTNAISSSYFSDKENVQYYYHNPNKNDDKNTYTQSLFKTPIIYVVWQDSTPGNVDIFFSFSTDNGQSFSIPKNISQNNGESSNPQIAVQGKNVYVVWIDNTSGDFDIFLSGSTDNGQSFSLPDNISQNSGNSFDPQIAVQGKNVYIVWEDGIVGNFDIFFSFSTDNGQSFSIPKNISENNGESSNPQIAVQGKNVNIVWRDFTTGNLEVFFSFSEDNGQSFSIPKNISQNTGNSDFPQIAVQKDNVYVVWEDTPADPAGPRDIFFSVSTNNGQSFSLPDNISQNNGSSELPEIAVQGKNVYIVWQDNVPPENTDVFFSVSTNNGQSFSLPDNISQNSGSASFPQIAVQGKNVYLVWQDDTPGNLEVFFSFSEDNGQSFSIPKNISQSSNNSGTSQIAVYKDNVYIIWSDFTLINTDIFLSVSTDNGQSFSIPKNISQNSGSSEFPQIAIQLKNN